MKIICQLLGGSHLYGLATKDSDFDYRGVFVNTDHAKILGLERNDYVKKEDEEDTIFFELCHFLKGLQKTNTQFLEILFADERDFSLLNREFVEIKNNKENLIDSKQFYKSLCGYIGNESRLANGERSGKLGSKRRAQIEKYGFSPKNFSHLLRLAYCGYTFFENNIYPVNIKRHNPEFCELLFSIKTKPEKYSKKYLNSLSDKALQKLKIAFKNRKTNFVFDPSLANDLCKKLYLPFLNDANTH